MAERKYMVVRNGVKKDSGEVYTQAWRVKEDAKNHNYAYLDEKDKYYIDDEMRPLGSVIRIKMEEADDDD